jgi:hypothetical protein
VAKEFIYPPPWDEISMDILRNNLPGYSIRRERAGQRIRTSEFSRQRPKEMSVTLSILMRLKTYQKSPSTPLSLDNYIKQEGRCCSLAKTIYLGLQSLEGGF